jgi:uncharacterized membrane protein
MARMTQRGWAITLFCSLAVNVLLAGVIVTAYLKRDLDMASRMTVYSVPWALRVIGREVDELTQRIYTKNQAAMNRERQALKQDYAAVNGALAAPQFDRKKFAQALGQLRADTATAQATMHEAMTDFAAELTPAQRQQLAATVSDWAARREQRALRREREIEKRERQGK